MESKIIKDVFDWNPGFYDYKKECFVPYEKKWYCEENKIIHGSIREFTSCNSCISEIDRIEFEFLKRLQYMLENYEQKFYKTDFSKISTEQLCQTNKLKISQFKPWQ
jgi:hypothetical protein